MEYKIGSFNVNNLQASGKKDILKIAEIIYSEELDVVALQEVLSEDDDFRNLKDRLEHELYQWDSCFAQPPVSTDSEEFSNMGRGDTRSEGYAYLWNTKRFHLLDVSHNGITEKFEPRIINAQDTDADCSRFVRIPYYIRLEPVTGGNFELRLINVHIYFGSDSRSEIDKRKAEYEMLAQNVYPDIGMMRDGTNRAAYTIAMGDYNLTIARSLSQDGKGSNLKRVVYSYPDEKGKVEIETVQDQLTTLKKSAPANLSDPNAGYASNYDHFTYSQDLSPFKSVSVGRIDALRKYCIDFDYYRKYISDHLPIIMTIDI